MKGSRVRHRRRRWREKDNDTEMRRRDWKRCCVWGRERGRKRETMKGYWEEK